MRTVALDVHKRFAEVAVHEQGEVRRLGRIETHELRTFAESLRADDHVVLESTSMTWAIAELLGRHAGRVTVSNPMRTKAIASAKVKTDKVDARVLAQLAAADFLPAVWAPDEQTRALRRRVSHRASLVRQRTRLRNQVHAVLARNLVEAPVSDLFGQKGRRWLAGVELPAHEREQVDSNLRLHDALDAELEALDGQLAQRGRCAPSTPASRPGAAHRSRSAPPPASWLCSAGTCSASTRTTATARRRSRSASCVVCSTRPATTALRSASPARRSGVLLSGGCSRRPSATTGPMPLHEQEAARVPPLGKRLSPAHEGQTTRGRPSSPHGLLFSTGSPAPGAIVTPTA
jgi:hypothetical protein